MERQKLMEDICEYLEDLNGDDLVDALGGRYVLIEEFVSEASIEKLEEFIEKNL